MPGSAKPRPIDPAAQVPGTCQRFRYKSMARDHMVCHRIQGRGTSLVEGTEDIPVAKPWDLRYSPFHGETIDGNAYTYASAHTAQTRDVEGEDQIIVPPYRVDDEIIAIYIGDSGVYAKWDITIQSVVWLDLNVAARAWAEDYD